MVVKVKIEFEFQTRSNFTENQYQGILNLENFKRIRRL